MGRASLIIKYWMYFKSWSPLCQTSRLCRPAVRWPLHVPAGVPLIGTAPAHAHNGDTGAFCLDACTYFASRHGFSLALPAPKAYIKKIGKKKMIKYVRFIRPSRAIQELKQSNGVFDFFRSHFYQLELYNVPPYESMKYGYGMQITRGDIYPVVILSI